MRLPRPTLLVITDRLQTARPLEEIAEAAFRGGCRWMSLREKDLDPPARLRLLARLAAIAARHNAVMGVHDDLAAAAAVPGAALHLPSGGDVAGARARLGRDRLIGLSTHSGDDLAGVTADYVTVSPVHLSASKPGYGPALGVAGLARAARGSPVPVIALGGIGANDVAGCLAAGAAGIAVMGGVMTAPDVAGAVTLLLRGLPGP